MADTEKRDEKRKEAMVAMQGATILRNAYVKKTNGQLCAQEEETEKKKKRMKRFDGTCKLLTGDQFFEQAVAAEEKAEREAREKKERKTRRGTHAVAVAEWKKQMRTGRCSMRKSDRHITMHCSCGRKNKIVLKQSADGLNEQSPNWENSKQQCLDQNCRLQWRARERKRMKEKRTKKCLID